MTQSIYSIIQLLKQTSSRNDKIKILEANKDNEILMNFFYLTLNPFINFFYKRKIGQINPTQTKTLEDAFNFLETVIASREITGGAAEQAILTMASSLSDDDFQVFKLVLQKKPDCGIQTSTVNKVWKNLVPEYPVMLAEPYSSKLAAKLNWYSGIIIQNKEDGLRVNIQIQHGVVTVYAARSGNIIDLCGRFDPLGMTKFSGYVLDGELRAWDATTKKFYPRKISNGICTKAIKGTISDEEIQKLIFIVWDIIPVDKFFSGFVATEYVNRLAFLESPTDVYNQHMNLIQLIDTKWVRSEEAALQYFQERLDLGEEGAMVKCPHAPWEDRRVPTILKLKAEKTCDLICYGIIPGEGKYGGKVGSLMCKTGDDLLHVSVGTGLTDADREKNDYVGSIIEVMYNEVITSKNKTTKSLFLPKFISVRHDKMIPDNLSNLK